MYAVKVGSETHVCIRESVGGHEISIAFDDSCGAMSGMGRGDIRVYRLSGRDVTEAVAYEIFGDRKAVIYATLENLMAAYKWAQEN